MTPTGMRRVLVTGASGFIGFEVARQLAARGLRPRLMVRRLDAAHPLARLDAERVRADLLEPDSLVRAVSGIDTVLHMAARATFDRSAQMQRTIVEGSTALLRAARAAGVQRFVLASSLLVYGNADAPIDARTPAQPRIAYGAAKLEAEAALRREAPGDMRLAVVRLPHVYGPRSLIFAQIGRGFVTLPGSGRNVFSHLHVEDAARLLIGAAERGWAGTSPVGDEHPASWNEFFEILRAHHPRLRVLRVPERLALACGRVLEAIPSSRPKPTLYTADTVRGLVLNLPVEPGTLWKELGLEPRHASIETGIPASLHEAAGPPGGAGRGTGAAQPAGSGDHS